MRIKRCAVAAWAVICLQAAVAGAQSRTVGLEEVLALARERAPLIVDARLAVEEARGRLAGASLRLQQNPEFETSVGNRDARESRFTDLTFGVSQRLEPGARRSARIAGAEAAVARSAADVETMTRQVLHAVADAYLRIAHAQEAVRLLQGAEQVAAEIHRVADRRFQAGDITVLDVNIALASLARVRAAREAAEARRALVVGELRQLLALDGDIYADAGALAAGDLPSLGSLLELATTARPELRALEAGVQEAEAEIQLGRSFAKPDYGLGVSYAREEGDQIVRGGLTISLPMFSRGQENLASGAARAARLRAQVEALRMRVRFEVQAAYEAYSRHAAAVDVLERDAIAGLDENDTLSTRSFEEGQLGLPELLLVRREILDTRSEYLDALLDAALAKLDLDASAGVLR